MLSLSSATTMRPGSTTGQHDVFAPVGRGGHALEVSLKVVNRRHGSQGTKLADGAVDNQGQDSMTEAPELINTGTKSSRKYFPATRRRSSP